MSHDVDLQRGARAVRSLSPVEKLEWVRETCGDEVIAELLKEYRVTAIYHDRTQHSFRAFMAPQGVDARGVWLEIPHSVVVESERRDREQDRIARLMFGNITVVRNPKHFVNISTGTATNPDMHWTNTNGESA